MPDINIINKSIDAIKSYYNYNINKSTLSIVVDEKSNNANHKLVPYMDFIQNYLALNIGIPKNLSKIMLYI